MDWLENMTYSDISSLNFSSFDSESDNITVNFANMSINIDEANITRNQSEKHHVLYQVPTVEFTLWGDLLFGNFGKHLVLSLVIASKKMRNVTNMFIANLALADIAIAMFTIPFQFRAALLQKWDLPHFLCAICPFVQVFTVTVSILTLVLIALDRYRAVIHPFKTKPSKKMAFGAILAVWVLSILLALPTQLDFSVIKITKNGRSKDFCANVNLPATFRIYYNQGIVIIQYFLPLFIISKAYFRIGHTILKSKTPGNNEEVRDALVLRKKEKVIKMLLMVVCMFSICWFPLQTYNFLSVIFPSINSFEYINILWFSFHWLAMSNSCCNPFIYAFYSKKFKTELLNRLPCLARVLPVNISRNDVVRVQSNNCFVEQAINLKNSCNVQVICHHIKPDVRNNINLE